MVSSSSPSPAEEIPREYADPARAEAEPIEAVLALVEQFPSHLNAQRLAGFLSHAEGFVYTVDLDLVFTTSVGLGLSHLQLTNNQLVGVGLTQLWGTSDPTYEPLVCHRRALQGEYTSYRDMCLGRSLEYQLRPLRDEAGKIVGVVGVGFDVTERERARERQVELEIALRQAQKMESIGRLAGGVAHDFNNLLTSLIGNLALAENYLPAGSRARVHLDLCNRAADSAASLTRQLLAFGRKQTIVPRPVLLPCLISEQEGMLRRMLGETIVVSTKHATDAWYIRVDPGQLEQILLNLVVNARDAIAEEGTITISSENRVIDRRTMIGATYLEPGQYVLLSVQDSGRGMSALVQEKLFEPFFTTKETGQGTGLGLAMVYGAVQQNSGAVEVESKLGQGSTFRVYFPRFEGVVTAAQDRRAEETVRGGDETLLLVEDEPLLLELSQCSLSEMGYRVHACASPDDALRVLEQHPEQIHLLVTDVVMPRINGRQLASRVVALRPRTKVLYVSGHGEHIIAKGGVVDERLHFLAKPYRPKELARKVREILDAAQEDPSLPS